MKHWYRPSALAWLLWPVSQIFGALARARRIAYRLGLLSRHHAGVPVIVVGNLVAGGSGKTPLVLWIAEFLKQQGRRPGIVARGWGGSAQGPREANGASDPAEVGDEPLLLARRSACPVWVGAERIDACRALRAQHPDCDLIVLDDGLQHYALGREIEICVVDARGFGNGMLLPAGPMREPVSRLASLDAVVRHGEVPGGLPASHAKSYAMRLEGDQLQRLVDAGDVRPAASFRGQRLHAVAGIGDPPRFFRQLESLGLEIVAHPYPDHHAFCAGDLEFGDQAPVVMTEKDAVKCMRFARPHHWVFPVRTVIDPAFGQWLLEKLGGSKAA